MIDIAKMQAALQAAGIGVPNVQWVLDDEWGNEERAVMLALVNAALPMLAAAAELLATADALDALEPHPNIDLRSYKAHALTNRENAQSILAPLQAALVAAGAMEAE